MKFKYLLVTSYPPCSFDCVVQFLDENGVVQFLEESDRATRSHSCSLPDLLQHNP